MTFFYLLASIITLFRIIYFVMCIVYSVRDVIGSMRSLTNDEYYSKTNIVDQTCQYLEIILGIQQFGSMRELSKIVWSHRQGSQVHTHKLKKQIEKLRFAILTAIGVVSIPMLLFGIVSVKHLSGKITQRAYHKRDNLTYTIASVCQVICAVLLLIAMGLLLNTFR